MLLANSYLERDSLFKFVGAIGVGQQHLEGCAPRQDLQDESGTEGISS